MSSASVPRKLSFLRGGVGFVLPAAAQGFVHGDERGGAARLTDSELVLRFEQNPLGVRLGQEGGCWPEKGRNPKANFHKF